MLAATGAPIDTEEQLQAIFNGLPQEYDPFVTSVMTRTEPYSIDEIEALLMAQEERMKKQKQDSETSSLQQLQANFLQYQQHNRGRGRANNRGGDCFQFFQLKRPWKAIF